MRVYEDVDYGWVWSWDVAWEIFPFVEDWATFWFSVWGIR